MKNRQEKDEFINISLTNEYLTSYVMRRAILEFIKKTAPSLNGTLLDIGCGIMPYKKLILSFGKVTRYIGLDLDYSTIHDTSVADLHWNGIKIPMADASVDSILATEFLEHYADTQYIVNEMHRVLKPNGLIVITVPFIWPLHETPHDEYRFTPFSLRRFLTNAGFKQIEFSATGGWHASLALVLGLWIYNAPMSYIKRIFIKRIIKPIIKLLIRKDRIPVLNDGCMMTGIGGIVRK